MVILNKENLTYIPLTLQRCLDLCQLLGRNIDAYARRFLWEKGLDYMHGTGHGIGAFLSIHEGINIAQKMKFFIKYFFSKCNQIRIQTRRKLPIWSHLLKKSLTGNFIFCVVEKFANVKGET